MPYSLADKLVVAIASSALFDLKESNEIFESQGVEAYRQFQRQNEGSILNPGVAFPFVRRLLALNGADYQPVEVV